MRAVCHAVCAVLSLLGGASAVPAGTVPLVPSHGRHGGRLLTVDPVHGDDAAAATAGNLLGVPFRSIRAATCHALAAELGIRGTAAAERWTVELAGGLHPAMNEEDAACIGAGVPMTVQGRVGERVLMSAGQQIPSDAFKAASGGVVTVSLPKLGLPVGSYGGVESLDCGALDSLEVFLNGEPLTLVVHSQPHAMTSSPTR